VYIEFLQATVEPHNLTVEVKTSASLLCMVNGFEVDNVSYSWEVTRTTGIMSSTSRLHHVTTPHLLLNNVTTSAAYRCIVTNSNGNTAVSAFSYVTVVGEFYDRANCILNSLLLL